jgi:hypothetical protein
MNMATNDTSDTIVGDILLAVAAQAAVLAKQAKKSATDLYANAEADAIKALTAAGVATIQLADGTKVTLKGGLDGEYQRNIDVDALADTIPATVLDKVTKRTVDLAAFDAAVTTGLITDEVATKVTTTTRKKTALVITTPLVPQK